MKLLEAFGRLVALKAWEPGTVVCYRRKLERFAWAGIVEPGDVTADRIAGYFGDRLAGAKRTTARMDGAALSVVLGYLVDLELYSRDELGRVRRVMPRGRAPRSLTARFLTVRETQRLVKGAEQTAPRLVFPLRVGLLSGLRVSELCRLRWENFRLGARPTLEVLRAPEWGPHGACKTGERIVPVCAELRELVIAERPTARSEFLFPSVPDLCGRSRFPFMTGHDSLRRFLRRAGAAAEIEKPSWCLVRHTRASTWIAAGVPIAKVAKWLGHTIAVCEQYYAGIAEGYDPDCERMPA